MKKIAFCGKGAAMRTGVTGVYGRTRVAGERAWRAHGGASAARSRIGRAGLRWRFVLGALAARAGDAPARHGSLRSSCLPPRHTRALAWRPAKRARTPARIPAPAASPRNRGDPSTTRNVHRFSPTATTLARRAWRSISSPRSSRGRAGRASAVGRTGPIRARQARRQRHRRFRDCAGRRPRRRRPTTPWRDKSPYVTRLAEETIELVAPRAIAEVVGPRRPRASPSVRPTAPTKRSRPPFSPAWREAQVGRGAARQRA